jgi:hypothetical protein
MGAGNAHGVPPSVPPRDFAGTGNSTGGRYSHVLSDDAELDYAEMLA